MITKQETAATELANEIITLINQKKVTHQILRRALHKVDDVLEKGTMTEIPLTEPQRPVTLYGQTIPGI
ncbi:MAG: hypothetical protein FWH27_12025 [Planctomycetaceae bacterium]|nr:hypothetical protein [Planctomycetaceae bacterium]